MLTDEVSLSHNAFNLLEADYDSSPAMIGELLEDAEADGVFPEQVLQRAKQTLLTPRLRLAAELNWLPELSPAQIAKMKAQIGNGDEPSTLQSVRNIPELARANILLDLTHRKAVGAEVATAVLEAWTSMDVGSISAFLASARKTGGFPAPDPKQITSTIADIRTRHASALTASICKHSDASRDFRKILDAEISAGSQSGLLPEMVKEYERLNDPVFFRLEQDVDRLIQETGIQSDQVGMATSEINQALIEWARVTDPVASFHEWRGLTAPRSKALFNRIRDWSLRLANEEQKFETARALSFALQTSFAGIPELWEVVSKDISDLDDLIREQKALEAFAPLYAALENAKNSYADFAKFGKKDGFKSTTRAPVAQFVNAYTDFLKEGGDPTMAANVGRDLALFAHNEQNDPQTAYFVLDFVTRLFTSDVEEASRLQILEDHATAFKHWQFPVLEKHAKDLGRAITTLDGILKIAPQSVRTEFATLRDTLSARRREKRTNSVIAIVVVAVIAVPVMIVNGQRADSFRSHPAPSTSSYTPSSSSARSTQDTTPVTKTAFPPTPIEDLSEVMPPVGNGITLGQSQIRYCVFQGKRLDLLRNMSTSNAGVAKFNDLINDYNSRCSNFRYSTLDMTTVEAQADARVVAFVTEAQSIAKGW